MARMKDSTLDLRELAMHLRSGRLSPVDHVESTLAGLTEAGGLVTARDDDAAMRAAELAATEITSGQWRGPLHGMAVAVSDTIDVAGLPTRCGSAVRAGAAPARTDAEAVARLRAAGAIVVAKAQCQELGLGPTGDVGVGSAPHNPHEHGAITGGASSGAAALVARGYVPFALGSDTGGDVRVPAALCGVVGLRPHQGAVPTTGMVPVSTTLDLPGLLTGDVHGASVVWDVLARGAEGTGGGIQEPGVTGLRIGLPQNALLGVDDPQLEVVLQAAAARLSQHGAELVEIEIPDLDALAATYAVIVGAEAHATHAAELVERREDFQPETAQRLLAQSERTAQEYISALRTRDRLRTSIMATLRRTYGLDALLLGTTPLRATPLGERTLAGDLDLRAELPRLTSPFSLLGAPAVSVPARAVDGLPIGIQVAGVKLEERGILRVAAVVDGKD